MYDMMNTATNAITALNTALNATSANIANMNVTGYKRIDVSFQSIYERMISMGTPARNNQGGTNPMQKGASMDIASTAVDFSQGSFTDGRSIDLAIDGQGFFILSPDGGSTYRYTRAGNFNVDSYGNLTSNGMVVYGLNASGSLVPITGLPAGSAESFSWDDSGNLRYNGTNTGFQIALTYFQNPNGLAQGPGTTFISSAASGDPAAAQGGPGGAYGNINKEQLEESNVFYLGETIKANELQRAMSANLSMISLASDMISQFINKLS